MERAKSERQTAGATVGSTHLSNSYVRFIMDIPNPVLALPEEQQELPAH